MAKKKTTVLDFDNDPEIVEEQENTPIENNNNGILSSVLSKTTKERKKIYTGFYLDEPVKKTIDKIVKQNKDTNKSKLVNDLLTEAFKQAGLMK